MIQNIYLRQRRIDEDYTDQNTLKFMLSDRDWSEFDAFIKELESQGLTQYLELANTTYKDYKEGK